MTYYYNILRGKVTKSRSPRNSSAVYIATGTYTYSQSYVNIIVSSPVGLFAFPVRFFFEILVFASIFAILYYTHYTQ